MRTLQTLLAPAVLLLLLACQPRVAAFRFGPWEEGLTLSYEDPTLPQPQRSTERLQLRVARTTFQATGALLVQVDAASTRGQLALLFRHQQGGVTLVDAAGKPLLQSLPSGFPAVDRWTDHDVQYRLLGRATWDGASLLPATADPVGYWVESRTPQGLLRRTLYLPNLGEVESREERQGAWVATNRLVAHGFSDIPAIKRS